MNRVWKRTLYKLSILFGSIIGLISYAAGCVLIGKYLFGKPEGGLFTGILGGLFIVLV